jgi:hypothetical protein
MKAVGFPVTAHGASLIRTQEVLRYPRALFAGAAHGDGHAEATCANYLAFGMVVAILRLGQTSWFSLET